MPPWSALPEHLNSPAEWDGHDDDKLGLWGKFRKRYKGYFAFGPRCTEGWARFREYPIVIFARGDRNLRLESTDGGAVSSAGSNWLWFNPELWITDDLCCKIVRGYLSRVQYWCKWHIGLQWPLFLHAHYGGWQFYIGLKRDADRVYWLSFYIGRCWK